MKSDVDEDVKAEERPETRLQLYIKQDDQGQVAATIPVRWRLDQQLVDEIRERGFLRPQLVIVVRALRQETFLDHTETMGDQTSVKVVPLTREMEFVSFRRPGLNEIRAIIVDGHSKEHIAALRKLRNEQLTVYEESADEGELSFRFRDLQLNYIMLRTRLEVPVPEEMFAPPPAEWRKKLVKRFFPSSETDQCDMRRRTILSVFAAILLLTFGYLVRILAAIVGAFIGWREMRWNDLLHPFSATFIGVIPEEPEYSYWIHKPGGQRRVFTWWLINPPVIITFFLVAWLIAKLQTSGQHHSPLVSGLASPQTALLLTLVFVAIVMVPTTIMLTVMAVRAIKDRATSSPSRQKEKWERERREQEAKDQQEAAALAASRAKIDRELQAMLAGGDPLDPSLAALAPEKRTVELRFLDLKSKVCKPFAR